MSEATMCSQQDFNMNERPNKNLSLYLPSTSQHDAGPSKKETVCGIGAFHPLCLQRFSTPKWFLTIIGLFVLVQSMLVSGITSSVITTIEKRYGLRSVESGLVVSAFDIGSLIVVIFISYFGGRGHRARWVGVGAIIVAIGAALFALPQLLSSPYQLPSLETDVSTEILCVSNRTNVSSVLCEAKEANSLYLLLFVVSNIIMGVGSTPIYTLGSTFIYDNVPKDDASLYVSMLYAVGAIGPAAGYLLGGFFLTFYVDLGNYLSSDDPRFLGAWWLGYLICAGLILLVSLFLLMFPRKLSLPISQLVTPTGSTPMTPISVSTVTETECDVTEDSLDNSMISFGENLKELPRAFISLLSNPIYLCVTCAATLEFSIVTAFLTFVPKYLQSHFNADIVISSIMTGAILVPSAGTGILLGGYIIKRWKLNMTGCAQTALLSNLLSLCLFVSVFFISCDIGELVGINSPNVDPTTNSVSDTLLSTYNMDCSCEETSFKPICHDGLSYYNPCYAGCLGSFTDNFTQTYYTNCSGIPPTIFNTSAVASHGMCQRNCASALAPFLCCLFLVTMATVCAHTPSIMVTYKCVKNQERPFAAGIQFLFFRALAYIPAPIYFGTAIDQACLLWNGAADQCADSSGSCLFYDTEKFRFIFFGVAFSCKVFAAVFMFLSWLLCRREYSPHTHSTRWRRIRRKKQLSKMRQRQANTSLSTIVTDTYTSLSEPSTEVSRDIPGPSSSQQSVSDQTSSGTSSSHSISVRVISKNASDRKLPK